MSKEPFRRDNHYVPQLYLRAFARPDGGILTYRTLVSRPEIPQWKPSSIKGVGYLSHLYTRIVAGEETDEEEKWFHREIETPADEPLRKAVSDARLTPTDWHNLIRFVAAQIVRTPAYFVNNQPRWREMATIALDETLKDAARALEDVKATGRPPIMPEAPHSHLIPIRVTTDAYPEGGIAAMRAKVGLGRGMWLFAIRNALTASEKVLHEHKWTILRPAQGHQWFTSDDPVICLNYYDNGRYDFGGGWGRSGSEILLPLSPNHLLYTHIGHAPPRRGEVISREKTQALRGIIAEHAYRMIFAASAPLDVETLRPRTEDEDLFHRDRERWLVWHQQQTAAEREVMETARDYAST